MKYDWDSDTGRSLPPDLQERVVKNAYGPAILDHKIGVLVFAGLLDTAELVALELREDGNEQ